MARAIIVHTWCDPCLAEDKTVDATELAPLALPEVPGSKPRVVALCPEHRQALYQPLVDLLVEHGQTVDQSGNPAGQRGPKKKRAADTRDPQTCPVKGCGHEAPNRQALASHARQIHDESLPALEGVPLPYVCPECGYRSSRPQGIGAHRRAAHGVVGAVSAGKQDDAQGDLLAEQSSAEGEAKAPRGRAAKRAVSSAS